MKDETARYGGILEILTDYLATKEGEAWFSNLVDEAIERRNNSFDINPSDVNDAHKIKKPDANSDVNETTICDMLGMLQRCLDNGEISDALILSEYFKRLLTGGIGDIPLNEIIENYTVPNASQIMR